MKAKIIEILEKRLFILDPIESLFLPAKIGGAEEAANSIHHLYEQEAKERYDRAIIGIANCPHAYIFPNGELSHFIELFKEASGLTE